MNDRRSKDFGLQEVLLGSDHSLNTDPIKNYGKSKENRDGFESSVLLPQIQCLLLQYQIYCEMIKVILFWLIGFHGQQFLQERKESIRDLELGSLIIASALIDWYLRQDFPTLDHAVNDDWLTEEYGLMNKIWSRYVVKYVYKEKGLNDSTHILVYLISIKSLFFITRERDRTVVTMSQSMMLRKEESGKKVAVVSNRVKISVPHFDKTELIRGYGKTLIGRCMNPRLQDIKSLLYMLPRIWKIEERVAGADLGMGRFQLDFDNEEDIEAVLKMGPFHFDHWMLSLVRWEPVVDQRYPFSITFWVRAMGVPLHFWAVPTFMSIGDGIGRAMEVDLDNGKVQVVLDGFKPLVFETMVSFYNGEETVVSLRYERLHGYCRTCFSLCHDMEMCPLKEKTDMKEDKNRWKSEDYVKDHNTGRRVASYKGVVINGTGGEKSGAKESYGKAHDNQSKGKSKLQAEWVNPHKSFRSDYRKGYKPYERRNGEASTVQSFSARHSSPKQVKNIGNDGKHPVKEANEGQQLTEQEKELLNTLLAKVNQASSQRVADKFNQGSQLLGGGNRSPKKVRKGLNFDENVVALEDLSVADGTSAEDLMLAEDGMDVWDQSLETEQPVEETTGEPLVSNDGSIFMEEGERVETHKTEDDEKMVTLKMEDYNGTSEINKEEMRQEHGEKKNGGKKKAVPVNPICVGRLSKKRLIQNMTSPRKKGAAKVGIRIGKDSGTSEGKSEMISQTELSGSTEPTGQ